MFPGKTQVNRQGREVLDKAGNRARIGTFPLGHKDLGTTSCLGDGLVAWGFFDLVEDLPPVGLKGVLVGHRHLTDGIAQAMDVMRNSS